MISLIGARAFCRNLDPAARREPRYASLHLTELHNKASLCRYAKKMQLLCMGKRLKYDKL
jgi:hypothetical protein